MSARRSRRPPLRWRRPPATPMPARSSSSSIDDGRFYFLEMNTRLQVEHPITEMVTGIDLVRWQIRIARGERLTLDPARLLTPRGHAIECRIYAEDPDNNFLPSPGRIEHLRVPSGPGVREDSGATAGLDVPIFYDPIVSKLIAWAEDRPAAVARMQRALHEYVLVGIKSTVPVLHLAVRAAGVPARRLSHDLPRRTAQVEERAAVLRTRRIGRGPRGCRGRAADGPRVALSRRDSGLASRNDRQRQRPLASACARRGPSLTVHYEVEVNGELKQVTVTRDGDRFVVILGEHTWMVDAVRSAAIPLSLLLENGNTPSTASGAGASSDLNRPGQVLSRELSVARDPLTGQIRRERGYRTCAGRRERPPPVRTPGRWWAGRDRTAADRCADAREGGAHPGQSGDAVSQRQPVVVIEAMKMENELRASQGRHDRRDAGTAKASRSTPARCSQSSRMS